MSENIMARIADDESVISEDMAQKYIEYLANERSR